MLPATACVLARAADHHVAGGAACTVVPALCAAQGTCTPLHSDVLRSHSWSANVAGRKLWRLLPPWRSHLLLDRHGRGAPWDFFAPDPEGEGPGPGRIGGCSAAAWAGLGLAPTAAAERAHVQKTAWLVSQEEPGWCKRQIPP